MVQDVNATREALRRTRHELLARPNVVAAGIGYKTVQGRRVPTVSIVASVTRKLPTSALSARDVIPPSIAGIPTDVVVTGPIRALQTRTERRRPAPGGVSIGHRDITAGTLGCLVRKNGQTFILSNNHVLANCFDDRTEVLTEDGFKLFRDLSGSDLLATLDTATGRLEYQQPIALQRQRYEGVMIAFEGTTIDLLVTPNHRLWARRVDKSGRPKHVKPTPFGFYTAAEILADMMEHRSVSYEFTASASWHCANPDSVVLPAVKYLRGNDVNIRGRLPIDSRLEFLGSYGTEGAVLNSANGQRCVSIRQTDRSRQLYEYLKPLGHSLTKRIPKSVRFLPPDKLEVFLRGYLGGDGWHDTTAQRGCATASRGLADEVQELFLKSGLTSTLSVRHGSPHNPDGTYYIVRTKQRPSLRLARAPRVVPYAGEVFCATVPNGTLFVRRNGKAMWSGNSNAGQPGDPILQPGPFDGGRLPADHIADLAEFVPIQFTGAPSSCPVAGTVAAWLNAVARILGSEARLRPVSVQVRENLVDAAIARPLRPQDVTEEILEIGILQGQSRGELGMAVMKSGRTTGLTTGEILQVDVTVDVQYGAGRIARFTDQLLAGPMSQGGDSGSAVLDADRRLLGLLFAGSEATTIFNRIEHVFAAMGVSL